MRLVVYDMYGLSWKQPIQESGLTGPNDAEYPRIIILEHTSVFYVLTPYYYFLGI